MESQIRSRAVAVSSSLSATGVRWNLSDLEPAADQARRDWDDLLARSRDFVWTAERAADWRAPWDGYTLTRYGQKAEREGRRATYLRFRRV